MNHAEKELQRQIDSLQGQIDYCEEQIGTWQYLEAWQVKEYQAVAKAARAKRDELLAVKKSLNL